MTENASDTLPPYLAFATFRAAVQNLRSHGLPTQLDKSAWGSRSGTEQGQIWGALRFLALVDSKGVPQPTLKRLVGTIENTPEEKTEIAQILADKFEKIFALDLKTLTPKQMDDAMGEYGVSGATRKRAVRFFIKAASHVGVQLSTRLTANLRDRATTAAEPTENGENGENGEPGPVKTAPRTRRQRRNAPPPPKSPLTGTDQTNKSNAMKTIELRSVGGSLSITGTFNAFQLMGEERTLVYEIIDLMTAYEQSLGDSVKE